MLRLATVVLMMAVTTPVFASDFDGLIEEVIVGANTLQPGGTRISIRVAGGHGSPCANTVWFAYEYGETGAGKAWTAVAMAAKLVGQRVRIEGTGTCDQHSVEVVAAMRLL